METTLRPDCANCAGLCCVTLAFDRSEAFPFDKPAGVRCQHLASDYGCTIHSELAERGCSGCVQFDCLGAGQRTTALFDGTPWRDAQTLKPGVIDAFRQMRQVHELLFLVAETERLPLNPAQEHRRAELLDALQPRHGWSRAALAAFESGPLPGEVRAFLATLQDAARRYAGR